VPIYDKLKFVAVNITKQKYTNRASNGRKILSGYRVMWCTDFRNSMILYCVQESKYYLGYDIML